MNHGLRLQSSDGQRELESALDKWFEWWPQTIFPHTAGDKIAFLGTHNDFDKFVIWYTTEQGGDKEDTLATLTDLVRHGAEAYGPIQMQGTEWQKRANEEVEWFIEETSSGNFLEGLAAHFGDHVGGFDGLEEWVGVLAVDLSAQRLLAMIENEI